MLAIDPFAADLIPLRNLPKLLPCRRRGKRLNLATVWRWTTAGYGPLKIKLPVLRVGANVYTSREALRDWCAAVAGQQTDAPTSTPRTPTQRQRASDRTAKELDRIGI